MLIAQSTRNLILRRMSIFSNGIFFVHKKIFVKSFGFTEFFQIVNSRWDRINEEKKKKCLEGILMLIAQSTRN